MAQDNLDKIKIVPLTKEQQKIRDRTPLYQERKLLNVLLRIHDNIAEENREDIETDLIYIAEETAHLNDSRLNFLASGENGEILAHLVALGIMTDFPNVVEISSEIYYENKNKTNIVFNQNGDRTVFTTTKFDRSILKDGILSFVTIANFNYSTETVKSRIDSLSHQIGRIDEELKELGVF